MKGEKSRRERERERERERLRVIAKLRLDKDHLAKEELKFLFSMEDSVEMKFEEN